MTAFIAKCQYPDSEYIKHVLFNLVDGETVEQVSKTVTSILGFDVIQVEPVDQFVNDQFFEVCSI